jgi:hypothetical protein
MPENRDSCADPHCGCHIMHFPTNRECPNCSGRLRLSGRPQSIEFRLSCLSCDYQSPLLSQEELQKVL